MVVITDSSFIKGQMRLSDSPLYSGNPRKKKFTYNYPSLNDNYFSLPALYKRFISRKNKDYDIFTDGHKENIVIEFDYDVNLQIEERTKEVIEKTRASVVGISSTV